MALDPMDTLKEDYKQEFDRKETLENKANNMTSVSGVVASLLFGFGALFVERLTELHYELLGQVTTLLLIGIGASLAAIVLSVWGFRIQKYFYVIGESEVEKPSLNLRNVQVEGAPNNVNIINAYKGCIEKNSKLNDSKARWIEASQWTFVASIAVIAIFVGWLLYSPIKFPS
jgi:hypothetical protein